MMTIDARGMAAPEPFERAIDALRSLDPDDELVLIVRQEPLALYRFLSNNRYCFTTRRIGDGSLEVRIRDEAPPPVPGA